MPAKKASPKKTGGDAGRPRFVWMFKEKRDGEDSDPASWCAYPHDQMVVLEEAVSKRAKHVEVGHYRIDLAAGLQRHRLLPRPPRAVVRVRKAHGGAVTAAELREALAAGGRASAAAAAPAAAATDDKLQRKLSDCIPAAKRPRKDPPIQRVPSAAADAAPLSDQCKKLIQLADGNAEYLSVAAVRRLSPAAAQTLVELVGNPPGSGCVATINRIPLATAASRMHGRVRAVLHQLGRPEAESSPENCRITMPVGVDAIGDHVVVSVPHGAAGGEDFVCAAKQLRALGTQAELVVLRGVVAGGAAGAVVEIGKPMTPEQEREAHCVAVVGPVLCMFDNSFRPQANTQRPFICVSIPGVNLAYSDPDRALFVDGGVLKEAAVSKRMRQIWGLALEAMARRRVRWPVLCAIGCGAFKGKFDIVPTLWAKALAQQLKVQGAVFECVVVCCPRFGDTNFDLFSAALKAEESGLPCCVAVVENLSMVAVADVLANRGLASGLLNPSDCQAVRKGYMGMYWDGGHIALEEILAMQTTLLLQHRGVNPKLWTDRGRRVELNPKIA